MRKLLAALALAAAASPAPAAETSAGDAFAGYSFVRIKDPLLDTTESFHGWQATLARNFGAHLGLMADFSGHYKGGNDDLTFMGGVRYGFRGTSAGFAVHALAGGIRRKSGIEVLGVSISEQHTGFAWAVGAAVSLRLSGRWDLRLQGDYLSFEQEGESQGNLRAGAGVAYRF
jgi:hypothetical protein